MPLVEVLEPQQVNIMQIFSQAYTYATLTGEIGMLDRSIWAFRKNQQLELWF